ncbi:MAG: DUF3240 family protein [Steroidobacteraceae bacterium]|nr:DUF3240 family protein [Dokdonella sp.]HPF28109.1 DUF3240 family protein [Steroidobacteraceae bacterium]
MNTLPDLVALNLAFPASIEEEIVDFCHDQGPLLTGFTISAAEGFGEGVRLHAASEVVLGRAKRRLLTAVVPSANVEPLLASLRSSLPSPEIVYWTTPILSFGRLA